MGGKLQTHKHFSGSARYEIVQARLDELAREQEASLLAEVKRCPVGTITGSANSRVPRQRNECRGMVLGKWDLGEEILLLAKKVMPVDGIQSRTNRLCSMSIPG